MRLREDERESSLQLQALSKRAVLVRILGSNSADAAAHYELLLPAAHPRRLSAVVGAGEVVGRFRLNLNLLRRRVSFAVEKNDGLRGGVVNADLRGSLPVK